jgi:small GTP-binding protein
MPTSLLRAITSSFSKPRVPNGPYKAALERCNIVAFEEYENAARLLQDAERLLRALQGSLARIAGSASRGTVSTKLAAEELDGFSRKLAQAVRDNTKNVRDSLDAKYRRLADFSITLFGRTMAGKSTIREAITGGDGRTIGKGAQRTTRDIRVYEWEGLRIVDTPGIAAYLGEQDRAVALSVVDESDVILFISSSDSIQEEEVEGLACLRAQNKPLIFVLNVKEDLTKAVRLKRFVSNPDRLFAEEKIGGYVRRLDRIVREKLAMQSHTIVPIHAQAAFLANRLEFASSREALKRGSRLDDLLEVLKREVVTTGPIRRIQCIK